MSSDPSISAPYHRATRLLSDYQRTGGNTDLGFKDHIIAKKTNYIIAVKHHEVSIPVGLQDSLLIKGNHYVTVEKVKHSYLAQRGLEGRNVTLKLGRYTPADTDVMPKLDHMGTRYIALDAKILEPADATSGSTPGLTPTTNAALPSAAQDTMSPPPVRAPVGSRGSVARSAHSSSSESSPATPQSSNPAQSDAYPRSESTPYSLTGSRVTVPRTSLAPRIPAHSRSEGSPKPSPAPPANVSFVPNMTTSSLRRDRVPLQPTDRRGHVGRDTNVRHSHLSPGTFIKRERRVGDYQMSQIPSSISDENTPHPGGIHYQYAERLESSASALDETKQFESMRVDTSKSQAAVEDQEPKAIHVSELLRETAPERLEQGVQEGLQLLQRLETAFGSTPNHQEGQDWLNSIASVRKDAAPTRTAVGVVGNTGAGKSALLNALLDEERLLPTNCMRACTAVVTEISYNDSDKEGSKYRAEIEYIKPEEWRKELEVLFEDIIDGNGNVSHEVYDPNSDAGIAYAKIRAVYFKHTKEDLAASSVESLMKQKHVQNVLGTTQFINESTCAVFYRQLQTFVDSKERSNDTRDESDKDKDKAESHKAESRKRVMESWPLIKVVRISAKSDALSTGAVVVDLPGVHDSNAARAAVADGYMKQCTGLWIVAPITRAVDDKAAKNLLGDVFRRQLKYDGIYSAVTFICSKSDDISLTEATDSLAIGKEMSELEAELREIDITRRRKNKQLRGLKEEESTCQKTADIADEQLDVWDQIQEDFDAGKTVYAPSSKKRKRDDSGDEEYCRQTPALSEKSPLGEEDIDKRLSDLKASKRNARRQRGELVGKIKDVDNDLVKLSAQEESIEAERSTLCIAGRNKYSKSAIRLDFAAGIKELDQENQAEADPDAFNPDEDVRDYDEVSRSLPVFCVSSRAYQKLSGRLAKDNEVKGFTNIDQTEIPALQRHAKKLTEGTRASACRRFLNGLGQLCNSLSLWASDDGSGTLTGGERDTEHKYLVRKLAELEKVVENCTQSTFLEIKDILRENIFEHYGEAVRLASDAALPTSTGWSAPRGAGGLHFMTYKATVRRDGVYAGSAGARDFNAELSEPLYKHLAAGWERTFQRKLPMVLKECAKTFSDALQGFHQGLEERARKMGVVIPRLALLARQLTTWEREVVDVSNTTHLTINDRQREVNREFTPVITNAMGRAYNLTAGERGIGSYVRMKTAMYDEVAANKDTMFAQACTTVENALNEVCKMVMKEMGERVDALFVAMRRDYIRVLGNGSGDFGVLMPKEQRLLWREVISLVSKSDKAFKDVIDGVEGRGDA